MFSCVCCHFETVLDDVSLVLGNRRCVCLRCYGRETDSARVMPKALREQLIALLAVAAPT